MDVERTIEFILENQAKHEAHLVQIDRRIDGITKLIRVGMRIMRKNHQDTETKLNALVDSQIATETKFRELAESQRGLSAVQEHLAESHRELAESHRELAESHRQLAESQQATDRRFQAFLDNFGKGHNGN